MIPTSNLNPGCFLVLKDVDYVIAFEPSSGIAVTINAGDIVLFVKVDTQGTWGGWVTILHDKKMRQITTKCLIEDFEPLHEGYMLQERHK